MKPYVSGLIRSCFFLNYFSFNSLSLDNNDCIFCSGEKRMNENNTSGILDMEQQTPKKKKKLKNKNK